MKTSEVFVYQNMDSLETGMNLFLEIIQKELPAKKVGIKVHFGETKNNTHISPHYFDCIHNYYSEPYYVECNVLYRGDRTLSSNHIKVAEAHGFNNLPIKILDGEDGTDYLSVPIHQQHIQEAKLGRGLSEFNNLISVAHFKGHILTGFGGSIKNVGMGLGSRSGKMEMHSSTVPVVNRGKCTACEECANNCDFNAITVRDFASIDTSLCVGCARCIAICPSSAISIDWDSTPQNIVMERIAEYTLAATFQRKWAYINFLTNMTTECDCMNMVQKPFINDLGILMSFDPVALDQASLDLIKAREGKDPFFAENSIDSAHLLAYAEEIKLGSRKYNLRYL